MLRCRDRCMQTEIAAKAFVDHNLVVYVCVTIFKELIPKGMCGLSVLQTTNSVLILECEVRHSFSHVLSYFTVYRFEPIVNVSVDRGRYILQIL